MYLVDLSILQDGLSLMKRVINLSCSYYTTTVGELLLFLSKTRREKWTHFFPPTRIYQVRLNFVEQSFEFRRILSKCIHALLRGNIWYGIACESLLMKLVNPLIFFSIDPPRARWLPVETISRSRVEPVQTGPFTIIAWLCLKLASLSFPSIKNSISTILSYRENWIVECCCIVLEWL